MSLKAALFVIASLFVVAPALADDREACANSYEKGQRLRKAHQLKAARAELLVCARNECQAWMKKDCVAWLGEVEAATPSIVVTAHGADGKPQSDVRITIDGALHSVTESISLDPGEHKLVVDAQGVAKIEQTFTLRDGEHDRKIDLTLTPVVAEPAEPRPPPPPPPKKEESRPTPALVWILGATGIVAAGVGGAFQLSGMAKKSDLERCSPSCNPQDVDVGRATLWTGNIVLGVAVVALVGAAVVYLTRPTVSH
jgi:hypothetical protein